MSLLFDPVKLGSLTLRNRFVRSATWEGMADEQGACTPRLIELVKRLAEGDVGLIITSHSYVRRDGQAGTGQIGIYSDDHIPGLAQMAGAVHECNGKIVAQLAHAGFFANPKLTGLPAVCMSAVEGYGEIKRIEMSKEDIEAMTDAFARAAVRAVNAGMDGIQIHAAHGYLLSQSLSPVFNRRTDSYGGPIETRSRFLLNVLRKIKGAVGIDFPVLVKMNCSDFLPGGLELSEAVAVSRLLAEEGACAVEVSGGTIVSGDLSPTRAGITSKEKEAYFRESAKVIKAEAGLKVILVGGVRSPDIAEELISNGYCDLISMSRPFIREPHLVKRWESGDTRRAACLSDNLCFGPARAGEGIYCVVEKRAVEKNRTDVSRET